MKLILGNLNIFDKFEGNNKEEVEWSEWKEWKEEEN